MRLIDEFAGIGGFSLAAYWMGWQTIAFVERDRKCQQRLRKRFGEEIPIYDDIETAPIEEYRGSVDIISAGFPCQPFSNAGKRAGTADDRYLWDKTVATLPKAKPTWFIGENVAGLATMVFERGGIKVESKRLTRTADSDDYFSVLSRQEILQLEQCCSDLESEGYEVQPLIIPACAVNASHRRDRVWIIAHSNTERDGKGSREFPRTNGEISEQRHDDAKSRDTNIGSFTNADRKRRLRGSERSQNRKRQSDPRRGNDRSFGELAIDCCEFITDATSRRFEEFGTKPASAADAGKLDILTNARDSRLQRHELSGASCEGAWSPRSIAERFANEHWSQAASRLCRMDDGLPDRVDRLKQLGNSVVPVEVFEIFRAIAQADEEHCLIPASLADRERSTDAKEGSVRSRDASI